MHAYAYGCACVSLLIILDLFQVKTGKSSLEQISRVYGNQVLMSPLLMHACPYLSSMYVHFLRLICTSQRKKISSAD